MMGRGKTRIARIENHIARQLTFNKRRVGLFKKSHELSVLCDAEIACMVISSNDNLFEFCSESSSLKNIIDKYLISKGLQVPQQNMQNSPQTMYAELQRMREETDDLELSLQRYTGQDLSNLNYADLVGIEKQLQSSVNKVRARKFELYQGQIDNLRKKVTMLNEENEQIQYHLAIKEHQVQVALMGYGHQTSAFFKSEDHPRLMDQFPFLLEEPCKQLHLAPLPSQFQSYQPNQPNLQDFSLQLTNYE